MGTDIRIAKGCVFTRGRDSDAFCGLALQEKNPGRFRGPAPQSLRYM